MCPMGRSKGKSRLRTILSIIEKVFDKSCDCFQEGAGVSSAACLLLKPLHLAPPLQYSRRPLLFVCLASTHLRLSSNLFGMLSVRGRVERGKYLKFARICRRPIVACASRRPLRWPCKIASAMSFCWPTRPTGERSAISQSISVLRSPATKCQIGVSTSPAKPH